MKSKLSVFRALVAAVIFCIFARFACTISSYAYISEIPNFVYVITDYIYVVLDAALLGISVTAITYICFNDTAKETALTFSLLSMLYITDSAVALALDLLSGAITSFDADLHVYPLIIATLYRVLLYLAVWFVASRLKPRGTRRQAASGFFHTAFGASVVSIAIFFAFDFASEIIYAIDFLIDISFKITTQELSSMLGQFLLIIVSRALIPAITAELYLAYIKKGKRSSQAEKAGDIQK